jgi:hypothetical protein
LRRSQHRDRFQLKTQLAPEQKICVGHCSISSRRLFTFLGMAVEENGLVLENDAGTMQPVSTEALDTCLLLLNTLRLSVFYSMPATQKFSESHSSDCGLCDRDEPADRGQAAVQFAIGFYDALGAGRSYEEAYNYGRSAISAAGISEYEIPVLKYRKRRNANSPAEQSAHRSPSAQESGAGAIAEPPVRPPQSQSLGSITISGSNNPFSNIQSGGNVTLSQSMSQAGSSNTDLQAALEALMKLKQEISTTDALSTFAKKDTESKINMLQEELQKPKPDKSFIDEVVEVLRKGLEGVVTLATPVAEVAALIARAYEGLL